MTSERGTNTNSTESSENPGGHSPGPVQETNTTAISSGVTDTSPAKGLFHPSDIINAKMLEEFPEATVAITHDDEWMSVLKEDDHVPPPANEFYSRVKQTYDPVCDSGVAQLKPKASGEQPRE